MPLDTVDYMNMVRSGDVKLDLGYGVEDDTVEEFDTAPVAHPTFFTLRGRGDGGLDDVLDGIGSAIRNGLETVGI